MMGLCRSQGALSTGGCTAHDSPGPSNSQLFAGCWGEGMGDSIFKCKPHMESRDAHNTGNSQCHCKSFLEDILSTQLICQQLGEDRPRICHLVAHTTLQVVFICPDTMLGLLFSVVTAGMNIQCLTDWRYKCASLSAHGEEINEGVLWKGTQSWGSHRVCFLSLMLPHLKNTKSTQPAHCMLRSHMEKLQTTSVSGLFTAKDYAEQTCFVRWVKQYLSFSKKA